ncbi:MAG TPA: polymer-forming cytoskeletal protein [Thermodesulfobacteriota bacterium]|nr:polymer-forming cytoskeletal protein [Thermodesulfobacteriota bacterium]
MFHRASEKLECLVGSQSDFRGEFVVKGTLRVDGRVEGRIAAECVILSDTGVMKGEITAAKIVVGGRVEGDLHAKEIVEIKSTGKVFGDIVTKKLSIMEGGEFNGKNEMRADGSATLEIESEIGEPSSRLLLAESESHK